MRILIVEDEPRVADILGKYLAKDGFETAWLANGLAVLPWLRQNQRSLPDLIILDLMLPGCDGIEVYQQLQAFPHIPVIMATARVDEIDRLKGLSLGADDYVCKPYSPRELVIRVKNVLRRSHYKNAISHLAPQNSKPELTLDQSTMQACFAGANLDLTPAEFKLLNFLQHHHGQVFSRQQLLDQAYDDYRIVSERTVDTHIKNLRRKLALISGSNDLIKSVYGVGYKLENND